MDYNFLYGGKKFKTLGKLVHLRFKRVLKVTLREDFTRIWYGSLLDEFQ